MYKRQLFDAKGLGEAPLKTWIWGSGRAPATPNGERAGPDARMRTVFEVEPPTTNPAIRILAPVPTQALAETLVRCGMEEV